MPRRSPTPGAPVHGGADHGPRVRDLGDHWKQLLQPPKQAVPVSVQEFVDEANRRLRADACFREGTRFVVAPAEDDPPGGSTWEGPEAMKPVVFRIVQELSSEFAVELPFRSDR
ncbi:MAG: hypothetical protein ABIO71_04535 [Caldimonas sp.]